MPKVPSPFDLSSESKLLNVAGLNPPATDLRGTAAWNMVREWGALEYDPTLTFGEFEYSFLSPPAYVLGENCDIMLMHPDIHGGDPVGFVLTPTPDHKGSSFSVQREMSSDGVYRIFMFFTVILADDMKNPDGSVHAVDRMDMYDLLLEYLTVSGNLSVITVLGCYLGIGPLGHSATELHLVDGSFVNVKVANITPYHPPVDPALVFACIWHATPPPLDARTWETSIWR